MQETKQDDVIDLTDTSERPGNYRDLLQHILGIVEQYPKLGKLLYLRLKIKYGVL